eukprot:GHVU01170258.1.p1 GENE.GHVU01170258.1~~GHVU01170258.1.p1  ORF type:complete len:732 (-),score=141.81 GHVU01170258.1:1496-3691(-)
MGSEEVKHHLQQLWGNPDPAVKAAANSWLLNFQASSSAWEVCFTLLADEDPGCQLVAAQTLRKKSMEDVQTQLQGQEKAAAVRLFSELSRPPPTGPDCGAQATAGRGPPLTSAARSRVAEAAAFISVGLLTTEWASVINDVASEGLKPLASLNVAATPGGAAGASGANMGGMDLLKALGFLWSVVLWLGDLPAALQHAWMQQPAQGGGGMRGIGGSSSQLFRSFSEFPATAVCAANLQTAAATLVAAIRCCEGAKVVEQGPSAASQAEALARLKVEIVESVMTTIINWSQTLGVPLYREPELLDLLIKDLLPLLGEMPTAADMFQDILSHFPKYMQAWWLDKRTSSGGRGAGEGMQVMIQRTCAAEGSAEALLFSAVLRQLRALASKMHEFVGPASSGASPPSPASASAMFASNVVHGWTKLFLFVFSGFPFQVLDPAQLEWVSDFVRTAYAVSPANADTMGDMWESLREMRIEGLVLAAEWGPLLSTVGTDAVAALARHCRRSNADLVEGESFDEFVNKCSTSFATIAYLVQLLLEECPDSYRASNVIDAGPWLCEAMAAALQRGPDWEGVEVAAAFGTSLLELLDQIPPTLVPFLQAIAANTQVFSPFEEAAAVGSGGGGGVVGECGEQAAIAVVSLLRAAALHLPQLRSPEIDVALLLGVVMPCLPVTPVNGAMAAMDLCRSLQEQQLQPGDRARLIHSLMQVTMTPTHPHTHPLTHTHTPTHLLTHA